MWASRLYFNFVHCFACFVNTDFLLSDPIINPTHNTLHVERTIKAIIVASYMHNAWLDIPQVCWISNHLHLYILLTNFPQHINIQQSSALPWKQLLKKCGWGAYLPLISWISFFLAPLHISISLNPNQTLWRWCKQEILFECINSKKKSWLMTKFKSSRMNKGIFVNFYFV